MFTGIIQRTGAIVSRETHQGPSGDLSLTIRTAPDFARDLSAGASIAINGVCLTVVAQDGDRFRVDVSRETLACTALRVYDAGWQVNLEAAATPATALGGHLVSGHVDGVGQVLSREDDARSLRFRIRAPEGLARYLTPKGSIAVDGVSLTVNEVGDGDFGVNIIPHTLNATIIGGYRPGRDVNLEVDMVARYLERLLAYHSAPR